MLRHTNGVSAPFLLTSRRSIYDTCSQLFFAIVIAGRSGRLYQSEGIKGKG